MAILDRINIRPGVSMLSVLQHLNYRPWFALAEFVDNSLQSFLQCKTELRKAEGVGFRLRVDIQIDQADGGRIVIRDNAGGIHQKDYQRAFRPAELPPDRSGLSEFGMGMKSAACWFAATWKVRTAALGEGIERTVLFDVAKIVHDSMEELKVLSREVPPGRHFTEISLSNLNRIPQGRTLAKIKDHLTSIYRVFLREGSLELVLDGDQLEYAEPRMLLAPFFKTPKAEAILWRKGVDFKVGSRRVHGFAALREVGSTSDAGFALFRRKRLIQGSADEGYRPEAIFGKSNSFTYQRLFGELQLEGFEVSHTKDGFRWDDCEDQLLAELRKALNDKPLPLLTQAEEYRARRRGEDYKATAEVVVQRTGDVIERNLPAVLEEQIAAAPESSNPPEALTRTVSAITREISVELRGSKWRIVLELSTDAAVGDWLSISDKTKEARDRAKEQMREIGVRLSLVHPFMERFAGTDVATMEPIIRLGAAIALAEVAARESGVKQVGTIRRNINELLAEGMSRP